MQRAARCSLAGRKCRWMEWMVLAVLGWMAELVGLAVLAGLAAGAGSAHGLPHSL